MRTVSLRTLPGVMLACAIFACAARGGVIVNSTLPIPRFEGPIVVPPGGITEGKSVSFLLDLGNPDAVPHTVSFALDIVEVGSGVPRTPPGFSSVKIFDALIPADTPHVDFLFGASLGANYLNSLLAPNQTELDFELVNFRFITAAVPEPSTLLMGLLALPTALLLRRRLRTATASGSPPDRSQE